MKASDFSDVFVSYRRTDVEFTREIVQALEDAGKEVWIDWEDIPPGSENFSDDIKRGLEGADAFIAVLSPDYLQSPYTMDLELGYALELNKRVIPIVWKKLDGHNVPHSIGSINWIFFQPHAGQENTFDESFPKVLQALEQHLDHARDHKRYLLRAIEWRNDDRNHSRLLVGSEIDSAERWLGQAVGKQPEPTLLHREYVSESRSFANKQQNRLLAGMASAMLVLTVLLVAAVALGIDANSQRVEANNQRATADFLKIQAEEQAALAQAQSLAAQANVEFNNGNHARALLLAESALSDYPYSVQAERALTDIFRQAPVTADVSLDFLSEQGWLSTADRGVRVDWTPSFKYLAELTLPRELLPPSPDDDDAAVAFEYTYTPDNLTLYSLQTLEEITSLAETTRDFIWVGSDYLWVRRSDEADVSTAALWDLEANVEAFTIPAQVNGIHVLDEERVLAVRESEDSIQVEIYSIPDGGMLQTYAIDGVAAEGLKGNLNRFTNMSLSDDANYLLWREDSTVADRDSQFVYRLHLDDGEILPLEGRLSELEGGFLVSDLLLDIRDGTPLLEGARSYARTGNLHIAETPDGSPSAYFIFSDTIVPTESSETPLSVQIYNLMTGEVILQEDDITSLEEWSPSGQYVILVRGNNRVMFSLEDGSRLFRLPAIGQELVPDYSWSPDENYLLLERRELIGIDGTHLLDFRPAEAVAWHESGMQFSLLYDSETIIYDTASLAPIGIFAREGETAQLDISESVNLLFPADSENRQALNSMQIMNTDDELFFSGMVAEDTMTIALNLLTYSPADGFNRKRLDMPVIPPPDDPDLPTLTESAAEFPEAARLSSDGNQLAVSRTGYPLGEGGGPGLREVFGYQPRITLHDATTLEELSVIDGFDHVIVDLAWSPDGTRLAGADTRESVLVFDVATGEIIYKLDASSTRNQFVRWSPDGRWLATGSGSSNPLEVDIVLIHDMETGELLHSLEGQTSWLVDIAWSPDSNELATLTSSPDNTLRLWSVETGDLVASHRLTEEPVALTWSSDSSRTAIMDTDNRLWVIDAISHEITHNFTLPDSAQIAWAGDSLYSLSDGIIREWYLPLTTESLLARVNDCCIPRIFSHTELVRFFSQGESDLTARTTTRVTE